MADFVTPVVGLEIFELEIFEFEIFEFEIVALQSFVLRRFAGSASPARAWIRLYREPEQEHVQWRRRPIASFPATPFHRSPAFGRCGRLRIAAPTGHSPATGFAWVAIVLRESSSRTRPAYHLGAKGSRRLRCRGSRKQSFSRSRPRRLRPAGYPEGFDGYGDLQRRTSFAGSRQSTAFIDTNPPRRQ